MQPPPNPYNQPNYGQPSYGQPNPGGQQPRGIVSLDVIGEAWKHLSANIGVWIGAGAIYLVAAVLINVLQRATQSTGPNGMPQGSPLTFILSIVSIFVTQFLLGGMMRMALTSIKTGTTDLSLMFSVGNVLLSLVGAAIINALAIGIGFVLCIVPGLIAAAGLLLITPIIVDGRAGALGAIGDSWNAIKPHLGSAVVLVIVLGLILIASLIPCGLGLLISMPLLQLSIALVYRDLFGVAGTPAQNTGYTSPPIANPNF